jgi:hypothetical protein
VAVLTMEMGRAAVGPAAAIAAAPGRTRLEGPATPVAVMGIGRVKAVHRGRAAAQVLRAAAPAQVARALA